MALPFAIPVVAFVITSIGLTLPFLGLTWAIIENSKLIAITLVVTLFLFLVVMLKKK